MNRLLKYIKDCAAPGTVEDFREAFSNLQIDLNLHEKDLTHHEMSFDDLLTRVGLELEGLEGY